MCKNKELDIKIDKKNKKIYKNIVLVMKEKKLSQKELSDFLSVQPSTICRTLKLLEDGKSILTETLFKIAYALDIEVIELFK